MPKLTIEGGETVDVPANKRLVLALQDEAGIDQLHACGGHAKCTTCRVQFVSGEPEQITEAERDLLDDPVLGRPGESVDRPLEIIPRRRMRYHQSGRKSARFRDPGACTVA